MKSIRVFMASLLLAVKDENKQSHVKRRWQAKQGEVSISFQLPASSSGLYLPVLTKHGSCPTTLCKISGGLVSTGILQASPEMNLLLQKLRINLHFSTAKEHCVKLIPCSKILQGNGTQKYKVKKCHQEAEARNHKYLSSSHEARQETSKQSNWNL